MSAVPLVHIVVAFLYALCASAAISLRPSAFSAVNRYTARRPRRATTAAPTSPMSANANHWIA
jgi:hypothetical protein